MKIIEISFISLSLIFFGETFNSIISAIIGKETLEKRFVAEERREGN
jgi:hypothetical protein